LSTEEDFISYNTGVRSNERRIWNISVTPKNKKSADEYLKDLIAKYRENYKYTPESGCIDNMIPNAFKECESCTDKVCEDMQIDDGCPYLWNNPAADIGNIIDHYSFTVDQRVEITKESIIKEHIEI